MNNDLAKIQELDERDIAASKAQDYATLIELWDKDAIVIPPDQEPIIGIDNIEKWLNQSSEIEYDVTEYEHSFEERKIIGDWAFEWGSYSSVAVPKDGGESITSSGKLLRILKRQQDGEWKVARAIWNIDRDVE